MTIPPFGWANAPSQATPVSAANLESMLQQAGAYADGRFGARADTATIYVAASGSDTSHGGTNWADSYATIQKAINVLPSNGGLIEVGYGTFAGFTIDQAVLPRQGVRIRGRGIGRSTSVTDSTVASPGLHPTRISSPCVLNSELDSGTPESQWQSPFWMEDIAISGVTGDGFTAAHSNPNMHFYRCAFDSNTGHGFNGGGTTNDAGYFTNFTDCRFIKNGGSGWFGQMLTCVFTNCNFDGNTSDGWTSRSGIQSEMMVFNDCTFQRNNGYGGTFTINGAAYHACQFEGNGIKGMNLGNGQYLCDACFYLGDNAESYAVSLGNPNINLAMRGCAFTGHTQGYAIEAFVENGGAFSWDNCTSTESSGFIKASGGWGFNYPNSVAPSRGSLSYATALSPYVQTLSSNGAVAIPANLGNNVRTLLSANATSSSINNPIPGQQLTIEWVQDGSGSRSYSWPSNCRFAGNASPSPTTTANRKDVVTFIYDGLAALWTELSRAVNVPVT